jgi:hypothetical protein
MKLPLIKLDENMSSRICDTRNGHEIMRDTLRNRAQLLLD